MPKWSNGMDKPWLLGSGWVCDSMTYYSADVHLAYFTFYPEAVRWAYWMSKETGHRFKVTKSLVHDGEWSVRAI